MPGQSREGAPVTVAATRRAIFTLPGRRYCAADHTTHRERAVTMSYGHDDKIAHADEQ